MRKERKPYVSKGYVRFGQGVKETRRFKHRCGFTLIELLVVITIISIPAAMLLPALRNARESAKKMACLSNMKQIAMGLLMYADDWNGYLPYYYEPTGGVTYKTFADRILSYLTTFKDEDRWNQRVWQCPSIGRYTDSQWDGHYYSSYALTHPMFSYQYSHRNVSKFDNPSNTVMVAEQGPKGGGPWQQSYINKMRVDCPSQAVNDPNTFIDFHHNEGCNVAFVDGHVQWMKRKQFYTGQTPADLWFNYYNGTIYDYSNLQ